ncbi:hypothetical protein C882_2979 [Caenispirillum salinarum AK4]|uniref:Uncharacterized protein n=1 Tax=Caenispirillum salinarum AK4 TaxID=1238182 RepID=K9H0V4_9PROT|nr:hypothetical protein [Caenispirillum salinarum]EKV31915.1 hypothetical protein C882_2979 [Caenispirillum salinarum AK4]
MIPSVVWLRHLVVALLPFLLPFGFVILVPVLLSQFMTCQTGGTNTNPLFCPDNAQWKAVEALMLARLEAFASTPASLPGFPMTAPWSPNLPEVMASAAGEGAARIRWTVTFIVLLIACLAAVAVAAWTIIYCLRGHRRITIGQAAALAVLAALALSALRQEVTDYQTFEHDDSLRTYLQRNNIVSFTKNHLLPEGAKRAFDVAGLAQALTTIVLAATASVILIRRVRPAVLPEHEALAYARRLRRRAVGLQRVIAAAAVVLVAGLTQTYAMLSWPLALLPGSGEDAAAAIGGALRLFVGDVVLLYGIFSTLVLTAALGPAILVLQNRSHDLARSHLPDAPRDAREKWLSDNGLKLTISQKAAEATAMLAPAFVGWFLPAFGPLLLPSG